MKLCQILALAFSAALACPTEAKFRRQAPNTLYPDHPESQTASLNTTIFVGKISRAEAQKLAKGRALLEPQGLPAGFLGKDEHPVLFQAGLFHDIRQLTLKIPNLSFGQVIVPFVDSSEDGKSPFFVAPVDYQDQPVPVIVGSATQGAGLVLANFDPPRAAWKDLAGDLRSMDIDVGINNDGLLGLPLPDQPVFSALWQRTEEYQISPQFFRGVLSLPFERPLFPTCGFTENVFDSPFADAHPVKGDITALPPTLSEQQQFRGLDGLSQTIEWSTAAGPGVPCASLRARAQSIKFK
ncbi:unnamed protein product [Parajaminaea phylloscopi]